MTAPAPFTFMHSTHRVIYAVDALDRLTDEAAAAGASKALVLLDAFFMGGPLEERVAALLKDLAPVFHSVPQHEPDTDTVGAAADALTAAGADLVVAIGGGSAMDTAKAARMLVSNPGPIEDIVGPMGRPMAPHPSLFVCAPTTAGTGSEVSESAIVAKAGTDYKMVLRNPNMAARLAILDPALGVTAPARVTASAGYDAVTHAVEAYTSNAASVMTDPFAEAGMRHLAAGLERAVRTPDDLEARGLCLIGSMQAGIAFNSANLGLAHAIAGALGALHHTPHGFANALALPWTMAFNDPALATKGAVLREIFGGESAAHGLSRLRHAVGLDVGLDEEVRGADALDRVAEGASKSGQIKMNPRPADQAQIRVILEHMRSPTHGGPPHLNL
ncbi:MAG: iron-containing alcohol dehydrogenase [Marivibrio sp.]|uniref:iron-containing alcohol dehydrogenase family protein n=1 Tax=Marivibrio sp. TaxID=2039719 RepID=UPI0032EC5837